jgi:hypothetical protein
MRVALFSTCLVDALFPDAGKATVSLLERLGQPLEFPLEQTCCGQMHANSGYFEPKLVRRYVDVFEEYDAVVVPSGSCAGAIRHQHPMVARAAGDEALAKRAQDAGAKTYELSEFLIDVLHTDDVGAYFPHRCGFGGTFSIKNPDVSAAMLAAAAWTGSAPVCGRFTSPDPREHGRGAVTVTTGDLIWSGEGEAGPDFPKNAKRAVNDAQLRRNVRKATGTIRERRAQRVAETPDWQQLRRAGPAIKDEVLNHLHR